MMSSTIKKISASCSIMALLIVTPFPTQVWANQQQQGGGPNSQVRGGELWGTIMGMSNNITQQMMAQRQQQQQMAQMQQMMSSLAPKNIPAKFFPQCQIPQTIPNTPVGVCEPPTGQIDQGTFNIMNSMAELGANYVRYYDQMLTPAQNSRTPTGLRCLEDAKTSVISSMYDRQNALQVLIDKINKETQLFRDENKKFLQQMDDINAELHGGQTGTNENKTMDFASEFPPECRKIIGTEQFSPTQAQQSGLLGIVENMRPKQDSASSYISNEANMEKSFERLLSKLSNDIDKNGVTGVIAELKGEGYKVRGFQDGASDALLMNFNQTISDKAEILQRKREVIQRELQGILGSSFSLPQTTRNFTQDFDRFIQRADSFYKKKFVTDCVTGADSTDLSLNLDQLMGSLEQRSTNSSGIAHRNYRTALQNILDQDSHIEDKLAEIRALDRRYNNEITVRYRTGDAKSRDATPYELFQKSIAACEAEFQHDKTHSTQGEQLSGAGSRKAEVERAKELMSEYKNNVQDFETGIVEEIDYRVRSCEGQEVTADSCSKEGIFKMNNPNFCFKNASQCSRRVQACNQRAEQLVEQRRGKLKQAAAQFNQNVQQLVTRQEQILNDVRNQVLADSEFLKSYFPGADYKYPEDLFVKMPELELRNGEMVYGGGEIDFEDLASNVGKLKEELANQSDKIDGVLSEYIADQKDQIQKNKQTWDRIAQECRGAARQMAQAKAQQEADQMEKQQKTNAELGNFCRKFNSLTATGNPAAGCSGPFSPESLYEDVTKVSSHLDNRVSHALGEYMALCNQTQNESERGSEDDDSNSMTLAEACDEGIYSLQNNIVANKMNSLPSDLESYKDEIEEYLLGESSELPQAVSEYNNGNLARELGNTKSSMKFDLNQATSELEDLLSDEGLDPNNNSHKDLIDDITGELEKQVGDGNDRYCATQAFEAAKTALEEATIDLDEARDSVEDFKDELEVAFEDRDRNYQRSSRAIASSPQLNQRWSDIGEGVGQDCAATANTSRGGGWLGEIMSPDMGMGPDVFQNLGIQR